MKMSTACGGSGGNRAAQLSTAPRPNGGRTWPVGWHHSKAAAGRRVPSVQQGARQAELRLPCDADSASGPVASALGPDAGVSRRPRGCGNRNYRCI